MLSSASVKARARELGFDLCGIAPAAAFEELGFLQTWVARRYYGTMTWLPRTARVRSDVRQILPEARSVIVTGTVYNTDRPYVVAAPDPAGALVSRYAWGEDYHAVIGARLEALLAWMRTAHPGPFDARPYVDTGPVQERVYAQYAGIGWIGKHTCLINPELGSWLFLGEIVCSLPLEPDPPGVDQCGSCQLCLQSCPTGAIVEPWVLDARLCISYLTIEKRGSMPEPQRAEVGQHVYGCDICQDVCPWNSRPAVSSAAEWQPQAALTEPSLTALWTSPDETLAALLQHGPMSRITVVMFRRNLAIAIGNAGGAVSMETLERPLAHSEGSGSLADPDVVDAVAWARARLLGKPVSDAVAAPTSGAIMDP
jgi:epoxyqueuosine reductase